MRRCRGNVCHLLGLRLKLVSTDLKIQWLKQDRHEIISHENIEVRGLEWSDVAVLNKSPCLQVPERPLLLPSPCQQ